MQNDELVLSDVHLGANYTEVDRHEFDDSQESKLKVALSRFEFSTPSQEQHEFSVDTSFANLQDSDTIGVDVDEDGDLNVKRMKPLHENKVITIEHALGSPLNLVGLQVWSGALLLCDYIIYIRHQLENKVILELGAGTGLCSIIASMFADAVVCTDAFPNVLSLCQRNIKNNIHLIKCFPNSTPRVLVKELDWMKEDPFITRGCTFSAGTTWHWTRDDISVMNEANIILAADVIYDNNLTDHLFSLIRKLLIGWPGRILFLSLEKRLNFTLEDLDIACPAYNHFLEWIKRLTEESSSLSVEKLPTDFPEFFSYVRTKYLELWKISSY